ncbi:MAG: hypothetical protein H5T32_00165 [Candidatus Methanosuratus sp.]|nr:hypothetical protein [Candidatus Methanosuratincola sp.]
MWCNISSEEEEFSAFLAALGATIPGGAAPELASQYFDTGLALGLATAILASVAAAAYIRHIRRTKG